MAGPIRIAANSFRQAAIERLKDAQCLHNNQRFEGAIYLCGYVLECFLKFVICETRKQQGMDSGEAKRLGHNLIELLATSQLRNALAQNQDLWVAFQGINNRWSPELRYSGRTTDRRTSEVFLRDAKDLRNWLSQQTRLRP
jgi:hypothetical protein